MSCVLCVFVNRRQISVKVRLAMHAQLFVINISNGGLTMKPYIRSGRKGKSTGMLNSR